MNGLETVPEIRKLDRRVPIIMFSTLTERGAEATLEALSLGATDYVTKPSNTDIHLSPHIRRAYSQDQSLLPWAGSRSSGACYPPDLDAETTASDPQGGNHRNPGSRSGNWGFYWRPRGVGQSAARAAC